MSRPRPFPIYPPRPLKHGGGARIKIKGRAFFLGKHGSEKSHKEYERLRLEHAMGKAAPPLPDSRGESVNDLIAAWLLAEPRGKDHPQVQRVCRACVPLSRLFGRTLAAEFRANRLRAVQDAMVSQSWMTDDEREKCGPWSRRYVNVSIQRILIIFRWGESTERLQMGITEHLRTVPSLRQSDRRVKDAPARSPVDWDAQVKPILSYLAPQVSAMIQVQYLAGMRPSEVCVMKRCEIDMSGPLGTWVYRPEWHKTAYRGHELLKVLGPECQRIIAPWMMAADADGYIFPPAKRRNGAARYLENGYAQAVRRAIKAAGVKPFCLYAIRHAAKLRVTREFGLDSARAHLGQTSLETTAGYAAQIDLEIAAHVAKKIG